MADLRNSPLQDRAHSTVDAIMASVDVVMGAAGVDNATLTEIAEQAGVSIGTLYRYFPNKTALVREYVTRYQAMLESDTAAFVVTEPLDDAAIDSLTEAFILRSAQLFADHPAFRHIRGWYDSERNEPISAPIQSQEREILLALILAGDRKVPTATAERTAQICIETVMNLIALAPPKAGRDEFLTEIGRLVSAYLRDGARRYPIETD